MIIDGPMFTSVVMTILNLQLKQQLKVNAINIATQKRYHHKFYRKYRS